LATQNFTVGSAISIDVSGQWTDIETTPSTNLVCTADQSNGAALPNILINFNPATLTFGPGSTTPIAAS